MILNSDSRPPEDLLDRKPFAEKLVNNLILTADNETEGFVVSITGKWGSGKTSMLYFIKQFLTDSAQKKGIEYSIVEFNPWVFADSENIRNSFLSEFASQLKGKKKFNWGKCFKWLRKRLGHLDTIHPIAGKFGKEIGKILDNYINSNNSTKLKKKIDSLLLKSQKKVFVFIDDIDRLYPKQIFEIFQILKLTCNFKNTYYVVAYDREAVELSIESQFSNYGKKYLDKIVQADFIIPEVPEEKVETIFFSKLDKFIEDYGIPYRTSELSSVWLHRGLKRYFTNLRDVYRYFNSLQFTLPNIANDIDITDFLLLEAIRLHDFEAYKMIQDDFRHSYGLLGQSIIMGSEEHLNTFENSVTRKLIEYLFPRETPGYYSNQSKRIYNVQYGERYFTLKVAMKDITELELQQFIISGRNRRSILKEVLGSNRFDNFIIRLNDIDSYDEEHYYWDFFLIEELFNFFNANALGLEDKSHRISDCIINLLRVKEKGRETYFSKFINLLTSVSNSVDRAKIYFLHFMILSINESNTGFPTRADDFKAYYKSRYEELFAYYQEHLKNWSHIFLGDTIDKPTSYYTTLFIYDYAKYFPSEYEVKLEKLLSNEQNLLFYLRVTQAISSNGEAHRIMKDTLDLLLPATFKRLFIYKIKNVKDFNLTKEQKQWREFFLSSFEKEDNQ